MIGSRRMAFPRIESLTMWLTVLAGFVLLSATLLGGFPTGWTGYAPLADQARVGIDAYIVSFALIGISLVLVGREHDRTVMTMRAPGHALEPPADLRLGHGHDLDPRGARRTGARWPRSIMVMSTARSTRRSSSRAPAAARSCGTSCSGSSATPRSTSSRCRASASCSRSCRCSRANHSGATGSRSPVCSAWR